MAELLVQMEHVFNTSNTAKALSESLCTQVGSLSLENRPVLQAQIAVPNVTAQQCAQAMAVVPEDICNLASWGCRDQGDWQFSCSYFTNVQCIFFAYRYFRRHTNANPLVPN